MVVIIHKETKINQLMSSLIYSTFDKYQQENERKGKVTEGLKTFFYLVHVVFLYNEHAITSW